MPVRGAQKGTHVALLDTITLEDVGGLTNLLEELLVRELNVLAGFIRLPNDGGL